MTKISSGYNLSFKSALGMAKANFLFMFMKDWENRFCMHNVDLPMLVTFVKYLRDRNFELHGWTGIREL